MNDYDDDHKDDTRDWPTEVGIPSKDITPTTREVPVPEYMGPPVPIERAFMVAAAVPEATFPMSSESWTAKEQYDR